MWYEIAGRASDKDVAEENNFAKARLRAKMGETEIAQSIKLADDWMLAHPQ